MGDTGRGRDRELVSLLGNIPCAADGARLPPLAPTGLPIELFGMERSEIRDGRLARHQIFWDMVELGRQVGAFPKRGTRAERFSRRMQQLAARRMRQPQAQ